MQTARQVDTDDERSKRPRRTIEQKIALLQERAAKLRMQQQKRSRQLETREKIVVGAAVINAMRENSELRAQVAALLNDKVTRPIDREAIAAWLSDTSTSQ